MRCLTCRKGYLEKCVERLIDSYTYFKCNYCNNIFESKELREIEAEVQE